MIPAPGPTDRTRFVLDFVQILLTNPPGKNRDLAKVLGDLAQALEGTSAGLASWPAGNFRLDYRLRVDKQSLPVEDREGDEPATLQRRLRLADGAALEEQTLDGSRTIVAFHGPENFDGFLWVEKGRGQGWTEGEKAALWLAGQTLAKHVLEPEWAAVQGVVALQQRWQKARGIAHWLAHDFGNILTGVLGFADLCLPELAAGSTEQEFVGEIKQAAERGAEFIRRLLFFSRQRPKRPGSASLAAVISHEVSRLRPGWKATLNLDVQLPPDLPSVSIDREQLGIVIVSVLTNSYNARQQNGTGKVSVTAREVELTQRDCRLLLGQPGPGPYIEVTLQDNGCGFSPENQRRFYSEPFYSSRPRHHGLGLAMVYGILTAHQGGFLIESAPEEGTIVRLYLPVISFGAGSEV